MNSLNLTLEQAQLVRDARDFAASAHGGTNHLYDNMPYIHHLQLTTHVAERFIYHIPDEYKGVVLAACWLHDTIEDCRVNYNEIKQRFGFDVAEIVFALTNEKGRTRAERADERYYGNIRQTPLATFVKLCDRIANAKYSEQTQSKMYKRYKDENPHFTRSIWNDKYLDMFVELRMILDKNFQNALL
jgi:(p)ppGpp synthase/HD superfamily hydrolase